MAVLRDAERSRNTHRVARATFRLRVATYAGFTRVQMVDYALWDPAHPRKSRQDKPFVLIESKGIDHDLNDPSTLKDIRHYAFRAGVPYVVLTNGKIWQSHVFPSAIVNDDHGKFREDVDIYDASIAAKDAAENLKAMFEDVLDAPAHHLDAGWICLKDYLKPEREHRQRPSAIRYPDGDEQETKTWSQLVLHTAEWLHTSKGCLVPRILRYSSTSELLVSSGEDGPSWHEIGDESLCVWTGGGRRSAPDNAGILLAACNIDLEDVYLRVPR